MSQSVSKKRFDLKEIEMLLACENGDADSSMEYEEDENLGLWSVMNQAIEKDETRFDMQAREQKIMEDLEQERRKGKAAEQKEREARALEIRKAEQMARKRIHNIPPGLRVFPGKPFVYFTAKTLDLENEFPYFPKKRAYLKSKLSMSDESITQIFTNPNEFVLHLSTQSRSFLIADEDDFVGVCDYLFYAQVATANTKTMEIFEKALMDLLRNYDYSRWQLKLKHILVALLNLGANPEIIMDENHYKNAFAQRINLVDEMYKNNLKKFRFVVAKLPEFFTKRQQVGPKDPDPADLEICQKKTKKPRTSTDDVANVAQSSEDQARYRSIDHLIKLVNLVVLNFENHAVHLLAPESDSNVDWLNSLILLYILATLSSDHRLIRDSKSLTEITEIYDVVLNSFSIFQWSGRVNNPQLKDDEDPNDVLTASCDIVESFFYTGHIFEQINEETNKRRIVEQRCWTEDELPSFRLFHTLDHFHNMVHRLSILPPTWRGVEIQKSVAFMNLQNLVDPRSVTNLPHNNMVDLWTWLETKRAKMKLYFSELYLILNILRLIDVIAGSEPLLHFASEEEVAAVKQTAQFLTECGNQFLRASQNFFEGDLTRVQEYINQLNSKWKLMMESAKDAKYETQMQITNFAQVLPGSRSNVSAEAANDDNDNESDMFENSPDTSNSEKQPSESSNS